MVRQCIHGNPTNECPICRHVQGLINQNTMVGVRAHAIMFGIRSSNIHRSMLNVFRTQPSSVNGLRRVVITPAVRQSARAYLSNPSLQTAARLRENLLVAVTPHNSLLDFFDSGSVSTTSASSPRFSRSALTVYSRLGSPRTPTSQVERRARSVTPMSALTPRSRSPSSNKNNTNRFSPPKKKPRKS